MSTEALARFKRLHLGWRQTSRDILALRPLKDTLEFRAKKLARQNDHAFFRLSEADKNRVRAWVGKLNSKEDRLSGNFP